MVHVPGAEKLMSSIFNPPLCVTWPEGETVVPLVLLGASSYKMNFPIVFSAFSRHPLLKSRYPILPSTYLVDYVYFLW